MSSLAQKAKVKWSKLNDTQKMWAIFLTVAIGLSLASQGSQTKPLPNAIQPTNTQISKFDSEISPAEFIPACRAAHEAIKGKLISPATADFPNCVYAAKGHDIKNWGPDKFMMYGYVDSQNVYGAQISQKWWATLLQTGDFTFNAIESGLN